MGLPFETPGGWQEDGAPDTGRYADDLTTPDYDGYDHDLHGGHQDAAGDENFFENDCDFEEDGYDGANRAGWDRSTDPDEM